MRTDKVYKVYLLYESGGTNSYFYVWGNGKTLHNRLLCHKQSAFKRKEYRAKVCDFIKKIYNKNKKPCIKELFVTNIKSDAFTLETFWILHFIELGFNTLNCLKINENSYSPYQKRLIKKKFTKKELYQLRMKNKWGDYEEIGRTCDKTGEMIRRCLTGKQTLVRIEIYNAIKEFYNIAAT